MKRVELLSPAGNLKKLKIAFAYGADAVYAGVSHFSLRIRSSKEFDYESFKEGVDYAHSIGKKVYATINGFPFNSQIELFSSHIKKMASIGVDAFIVSTPGVIRLCKEIAPDIPIHLSTQANVMNYLDALVYYEMGVSRIIAAREISLKDLVKIKEKIPDLELEIFVHGSMCFAYSGRCLISSVQSGRVPNRGSCANDCRFEYTLYAENPETKTLFKLEEVEGEGTYIMNAKDLNLASHIKEILDTGVIDSLKIEGRTKSDYYVAITTKVYKMAIDDYYANKFNPKIYQKELHTTKHRGFSDGYLVSRPYEKSDTQKLDSSISEGSHQVKGEILEDGLHFLTKDKICKGDILEIVAPVDDIKPCKNEIGEIFKKDGEWFLRIDKIKANKEYECIHSGNINEVKLPCYLPPFSFLRKRVD
jgi:putative protease